MQIISRYSLCFAYLSRTLRVGFALPIERERYAKGTGNLRERYAKPPSCPLSIPSVSALHIFILFSRFLNYEMVINQLFSFVMAFPSDPEKVEFEIVTTGKLPQQRKG